MARKERIDLIRNKITTAQGSIKHYQKLLSNGQREFDQKKTEVEHLRKKLTSTPDSIQQQEDALLAIDQKNREYEVRILKEKMDIRICEIEINALLSIPKAS